MANRPDEYYRSLVAELSKLTDETEWVEFKVGNDQPERIAKYISALSNSAALCGKPTAYLFWGIDDSTHEIVGAPFSYRSLRKGNEELEEWLARMVNPKLNLSFHDVDMGDGTNVVILEVPAATHEPTRYGPSAYVRVGSNVKSLANFKDREAQLWRTFDSTPAELRTVADGLSEEELFGLLDYPGYYRSLGLPIPAHRNQTLADLAKEKFIAPEDAGTWSVTALGALMIAYDLGAFDGLARRVIRVVKYKGDMRLEDGGDREESFPAGYAISYEEIARYIMAITPSQEVLDGSIRRQHTAFPEIAVRELLANMMVHQSLDQRGTNPMVEVFSNRIEFSNPGAPLVPIERLIDTVPLSRATRTWLDSCANAASARNAAAAMTRSSWQPARTSSSPRSSKTRWICSLRRSSSPRRPSTSRARRTGSGPATCRPALPTSTSAQSPTPTCGACSASRRRRAPGRARLFETPWPQA